MDKAKLLSKIDIRAKQIQDAKREEKKRIQDAIRSDIDRIIAQKDVILDCYEVIKAMYGGGLIENDMVFKIDNDSYHLGFDTFYDSLHPPEFGVGGKHQMTIQFDEMPIFRYNGHYGERSVDVFIDTYWDCIDMVRNLHFIAENIPAFVKNVEYAVKVATKGC